MSVPPSYDERFLSIHDIKLKFKNYLHAAMPWMEVEFQKEDNFIEVKTFLF